MKQAAMVLTAVSMLALLANANEVPRFGMFETSVRQGDAYDNPYKELTASAILRRPDGNEWVMPLFWDGKTTWTLRVSPDVAGEWSYSVRSADAGLNPGCIGSLVDAYDPVHPPQIEGNYRTIG